MCGISGYFMYQSFPTKQRFIDLFMYGRLRGTDGFGILHYSKDKQTIDRCIRSSNFKEDKQCVTDIWNDCTIGSLVLSNHRMAPETESSVKDIDATLQPVININNNIGIVHNGSVSNFIIEELKSEGVVFNTNIDSEAIIHIYEKTGFNMEETMKQLSGGFAFLLIDCKKNKLYACCTHNPLYVGYVRGHGMFFSSIEDAIWKTISNLKGITLDRMNITIWEDFYCQMLPSNTVVEFDLDSGHRNEYKFEPRYVTPKWDPYIQKSVVNKSKRVLVSASGGLDSTTTACILKKAGYDPHLVHFIYGHRGNECEHIAIKEISKILDLKLHVFDIKENMKILDSGGMLTNSNEDIITGTVKGSKTTAAWTCFRNHLFMTYLGALSESMIMNELLDVTYITGGMMQLSESGSYPDNSERFLESALKFFKFSIGGYRIKPLFGLCNLLKWEQYILLKELNLLEDLSPHLISCDRPKMIEGIPHNCSMMNTKTNQIEPACGSGRRSWYSSQIAGVSDSRIYYTLENEDYDFYNPPDLTTITDYNLNDILDKILIDKENLDILKEVLL